MQLAVAGNRQRHFINDWNNKPAAVRTQYKQNYMYHICIPVYARALYVASGRVEGGKARRSADVELHTQ